MVETDAQVWTRGKRVFIELPAAIAKKLRLKNHENVHIAIEHKQRPKHLHQALTELYSHRH